jgi:hypothetical protein
MIVYTTLKHGIPSNDLKVSKEGNLLRIWFDYEKVENTENNKLYKCYGVDIIGGNGNYAKIVSSIISEKYPIDEVQAILSNKYLADDNNISEEKRAKYLREYQEFQDWRAHAKEIAKKVLIIS